MTLAAIMIYRARLWLAKVLLTLAEAVAPADVKQQWDRLRTRR